MEKVLLDFFTNLTISIITSVITIFLGVNSIKEFIRERDKKKEIGELKTFWSNGKVNETYHIFFGTEQASDITEVEPRLGYSEAFGISQVSQALNSIYDKNVIVKLHDTSLNEKLNKECFNENVIIFGSELSISAFGDFCRTINVPYHQYSTETTRRTFTRLNGETSSEVLYSIVDVDSKKIINDIGSVVRIFNNYNKKLIILFNGNYAAGLLSSILSVTNKDLFFNSKTFDKRASAQQLVVSTSNIKGVMQIDHPVKVLRDWESFDITSEQLNNAISKITIHTNNQSNPLIEGQINEVI